ncbi:MAG TPA: alpha-glucosidase [Anaerolineae bacterium]|nr:alpha-glucosidase [Anaerolineae bacterium]
MKRAWWKESVVYQIYPRSFCDSNGDGIGDLRGITSKLDYLEALGVDVVWLSPVYQSPNDDNGYDISDYRAIMGELGTMSDWEEMLEGMHRRGIRLVMDLVVNHTSDEHPWFVESRKSRSNPYRDYYIWRPPKEGREPNNWASHFSGSAWELDEATGEYYLHLFSKKQPDLNWENPRVRAEIWEMMRWWLDKGVDGFRMDVINMISKVPGLPDMPAGFGRYVYGGPYFINGPRLLEYLAEMRRAVLSRYDILSVGETPLVTTQDALALTDEDAGALNMVFQFEHVGLDTSDDGSTGGKPRWLPEMVLIMTRWQADLEGRAWNSLYLGNHDQPRSVSRFGDDGRYRVESAKMLATLIHMLQGTPYIYQGEEIGMTNVAFGSIDDYRDIQTLNLYREQVEEMGMAPAEALAVAHARSRDNARTPMQWDDRPNAGFSTATPWIKVNPNYPHIHVAQALADPGSIWHYYRQLIRLRRQNPTIVYGRYDLVSGTDPGVYAFTRTWEGDRLLVVLSFAAGGASFALPDGIPFGAAEPLIGNYPIDPTENVRRLCLRPYEARVYRLR